MKCLLQSPCPNQQAYCECGNAEECEYKGECTECEWFYKCKEADVADALSK